MILSWDKHGSEGTWEGVWGGGGVLALIDHFNHIF